MFLPGTISLSTQGFCDIQDVTSQVAAMVSGSGVKNGAVTVFCPGSTGAVTTI